MLRLCCIQPSNEYKVFKKAISAYKHEIKVTRILKQLRVFNAYIKNQLSNEEWSRMWHKYAKRDIESEIENYDELKLIDKP